MSTPPHTSPPLWLHRRPVAVAVVAVAALASALLAWRAGRATPDPPPPAFDGPCYQGPLGATAAIPAGRLLMGSERHYPEEAPVSPVAIEAFTLDRHEVTNAQFKRFVDATGYVTSAERAEALGYPSAGSAVFADGRWAFVAGANWRHPDGPGEAVAGREREPVVQVSLEDARAYAAWAGRRLPTEAEYEFAARGGRIDADGAAGADLTPDAGFPANTWQGIFPLFDTGADGRAGRAPAGCYPPNAFGVYDLIGNVWEWTVEAYYPGHDAAARGEAPDGAGFDPRQPGVPVGVIKGGSYLCAENFCRRARPAARQPQDTQLGTNHIGFRTAGP